ncbi:PREDICTED: uncharacterized protein LOC109189535 [Ipomoea nil]|uniref:uncharacterized protein LOC109189535 n=1 Tax=Ipomoea nil TaxID=35883 RepID=UPI000901A5B1|nr:PREDICTED: uncharacterized protein LOC109189535 [Ipomoea nil]
MGEEVNSPASVHPSQKEVDDTADNSRTIKRSLLDEFSSSKSDFHTRMIREQDIRMKTSVTNFDIAIDDVRQNSDIGTSSGEAHDEYCDLGDATNICVHCGALFWFEERKKNYSTKGSPMFSLCCNNGKIKLPANTLPSKGIFDLFFGNDELSKKFLQNIRTYNNMFCFTSMGGKIDTSVNKGGAPLVFRLSGQNYHLMGSLLPEEGKAPHFAQLYIYDTANEKNNRVNAVRCKDIQSAASVRSSIGDLDTSIGERDIVVQAKGGQLQRIIELNPSYLPLQYQLLFPYGEDDYREDIAFSNVLGNRFAGGRQRISPREFFCYRIQTRDSTPSTILFAKRLFQQFVVDGYTMVESGRLIYIRTHQKSLRCETYSGLTDALTRGEVNPAAQGRRIILPSSFTGDARYMIQNYQDAMLDSLIADCRKNKLFGSVAGVIYTIEFQKRGLPHAHIFLFLEKNKEVSQVVTLDKIFSAEIPDEKTDVEYYKAVEEFMMHGPCGKARSNSPCMVNARCSKHFPKRFVESSTFDDDGYPVYRRRDNGSIVTKNGIALDNRYISPCEAVWSLFGFDIQLRAPSVERLSFHLPNQQSVVFADDDPVENIVNRPTIAQIMFLEWFEANKTFPDARELTYVEMPTRFVWKKDLRKWQPRKKRFSIGRIFYVPPATGEIFYLRCLLNKIRGPTSYADIRTVNGVHYVSFRDACYARGLVDDDNEYVDAIDEASHWASADQLRRLFVTLLMSSCMDFVLTESHKMNFALVEIEKLLSIHGKSLKDYPEMPTANFAALNVISNRLIQEELAYDCMEQEKENQELVRQLTEEQKVIYNEVLTDIDRQTGGLFFVYGYGGTGKTFLWRALSSALRTAHSRFAIPISINEDSTCNISHGSQLAELIVQSKLIIWDEAPMMHKFCFEALDRTMRDLLRFKNPRSYDMTFGGKTVVFGGDLRQILPVIPKSTRQDIVRASISSSYLWKFCKVFRLTKNLRLRNVQSQIEGKEIEEFAKWIANIGNGTVGNQRDGESDITVPEHLLLRCEDYPIATIVDSTFPNFRLGIGDLSYLNDSAILAPTLDVVDSINQYMNDHNPAEGKTYLSCDSVCKSDSNVDMLADFHTPEFLNGLRCSGVPHHALTLKVGSPVMLLRNIDHTLGLCNGTRLIVTRLADHVLEGKIMCGTNAGTRPNTPLQADEGHETTPRLNCRSPKRVKESGLVKMSAS